MASDAAIAVRDDVAYFQAIKAALAKPAGERQSPEALDAAVRQLVSKAITASDGVIDIFTAAGLKKPDVSILSDQFLAEVRGLTRDRTRPWTDAELQATPARGGGRGGQGAGGRGQQ